MEMAARRLEPGMKEAAVPATLAVEAAAPAEVAALAEMEAVPVEMKAAPAEMKAAPAEMKAAPAEMKVALAKVAPVNLAARALAETQERAPGTVPPQNN